jgi:hypothetical protein
MAIEKDRLEPHFRNAIDQISTHFFLQASPLAPLGSDIDANSRSQTFLKAFF